MKRPELVIDDEDRRIPLCICLYNPDGECLEVEFVGSVDVHEAAAVLNKFIGFRQEPRYIQVEDPNGPS